MTTFTDRHGVSSPLPAPDAEAQVRADDRAHVFHSWSAQALIDPLPVAAGQGSTFWDYEGTAYLDFSSQLVNLNLGHQHPDLVAAIQRQAGRLATIQPSMANDVRGELARLIAEVAPDGFEKVFFTNGGAEANEYAVRMARQATGRRKVLSMYRSYHGSTATAISLTGDPRRWANDVTDTGAVRFFGPYLYRSPLHSETPEQETERALAHLEQTIQLEGPQTIAAIIVETVVGTNGVLLPPPGYLPGVRALCDRYGIVFIADEVMVGFGRLGEWFGIDAFEGRPDLITFAKGVNSGYVPLGGVVISDRIAAAFDTVPFAGGLTYSGHPLACAAGVATFEVFRRDGILERVRDLGERIVGPTLRAWASSHPSVGEVRGRGLFWGVELVRDQRTREPLVPFNASGADAAPMTAFAAAAKRAGVWPFTHFHRVHIAPPLVIEEAELVRGLAGIEEALAVADGYAVG
ncbi:MULTISPECIES: aspartate aminotransferase family protein [unclassified Microbacterium]|uniref:aspartate aminotransferase family protein n=1 Tax=unclassified Microbacterium TaxID=2609290 RepID=UPI0024687737|nr:MULTISPECIES: aspartate aminotransferase family protein [unclassified Microbacterium]MDH5134569.1 aspartate aminotransferase family protein [Microbacterium sp. RD10]MDH5138123.1 aspartate aminotransferase family protein [Microbacterium sp. RD11]MDH5146265.1 aspartate aminotransferase family protein [Microbacterium sp. RD12]MDH5156423.1 aspartate aminotransferase family protein [Microbacterium sp. RD06]MDH5167658.1 aspartate aminotransferase family protein [Microbacterium sp. RD02]